MFEDDTSRACRAVANRCKPTNAPQVLDVHRDSPATAETVQGIYDVAADDQAVFLVRSDGYIGFAASHQLDEEGLHLYMSRVTAEH